MGVAQQIQEAWNKQSRWLMLLRPLSCLYRCGFQLNKQLYRTGLKKTYHATVPVMVIGNITVGGSGKTPLLIQLVKFLQQHNIRVGVISRGYGGTGPFPALVLPDSSADCVGDEPCLIVQNTHVPMAVGPDRQQAIELLLQHQALDLIISDDGLQHWALARQLEWIVLDNNRGLGNQKLLPEGYLREPVSRLQGATVIEHSAKPTAKTHMHLQVGQPYLLNQATEQTKPFDSTLHYHAVVGIGYPQRFYDSLKSIGLDHFKKHEFADHYAYEWSDLQFDDTAPMITTEKDAVKIKMLLQQQTITIDRDIWVLPVEAVLSAACYSLLEDQLRQLNINITKV
ncbi:tetraacyldisaccharide 4'-kinase [Acinetobacter sp. ME22]|uniref:tetraacyldisaccharide 4'-kinase n=1 Tax=Acinetobacter sp. ME22 TaxID=2904802 RepID=UPI001EDB2065|nr:tetraacyldisaccharide 4'-kinase [Acinetobacter sp. ME22]MCG2575149.1 tetraacyldisaccharide 4'-kinase [Acinetobacter sp. ME22]